MKIKRETSRFEKQRQANPKHAATSSQVFNINDWIYKIPIISGIFRAIAISFMDCSLCFLPCFFLQNRKLEVGGRQYMRFDGKKTPHPNGSKSTIGSWWFVATQSKNMLVTIGDENAKKI